MCEVDIVKQLEEQYNGNFEDCVDEHEKQLPLYMCFGLMTRAFDPLTRFFWADPNPKGSLSASFLHKNAPLHEFYKGRISGVIMYPPLKTPHQYYKNKVFCAFPTDAMTECRQDNHGCTTTKSTEYTNAREKSNFCRTLGITTRAKWERHVYDAEVYQEVVAGKCSRDKYFRYIMFNQCAFKMDGEKNAAEDFEVVLDLNADFANYYSFGWFTEILISPWEEETLPEAPIQAFFYGIDRATNQPSKEGLENARKYQKLFKEKTGGWS